MKFGYTILFVADVANTLAFYEKAFGAEIGFSSEAFGSLKTGETTLAFGWAENEKRELGPKNPFRENRADEVPAGAQISFVTDDVEAAFAKAVAAGALPVVAPNRMPWGQTVSRVRDLNGFLVSLVTAPRF